MFTNILSLIIKEEDYELLLGLSETERSVIELNISNKYFQKAKNYFERILEVDSERWDIWDELAHIMYHLGMYKRAIENCENDIIL